MKCFGNNGPRLPELAECPLWPLSEGRLPFLCSGLSVKIISATPFSISIIIAVIAICRDKLVSGVHTYIYILLLQNRIMVVCEVRRKEVKMLLLF